MNVFSGWRERNCYFGRVQIGRSREVHPLLRTAIISCRKSTSNSCDEVACVQEEVGGNDDDDGGGGGGGGVVGLSELLLGGSFPTASLPTIVSPGSDSAQAAHVPKFHFSAGCILPLVVVGIYILLQIWIIR